MNAMKACGDAVEVITIGQHFAFMSQHSDHTLEDQIYSVSNGQYEPNALFDKKYKHWPALLRYCREWVDHHSAGPYVEWQTEADLMDYGMKRLAKDTALVNGNNWPIKAPGAWLPVIKRLRGLAKEAQTRG